MSAPIAAASDIQAPAQASWSPVLAMTLCTFTLIASEFLPVSLLTPIASDLHMSGGTAGQAISVSGFFAVITSLLLASATRGIDRRRVLLALTGLMAVSGVVVTFAPTYPVLMAGRALLGVVIGGFWSMTTAVVMRLVPHNKVPRALAMLNGGNALATTIGAPLGSYMGQYIGWRGAFFAIVPLAAATFVWLLLSLPAMAPLSAARSKTVFGVLRKPGLTVAMIAVALLFMGQFALFTYLRPFLETVTRVKVDVLSMILLVMGLAGVLGTSLIGAIVRRSLTGALAFPPLILAAIALALVGLGAVPLATASLLAVWGMVATAAPVAWWTWLSRALPEDAEAGGGLMVATIQMAITLGAALGGQLFDHAGYRSTFLAAALLLLGSSLLSALRPRS